jgi:hypothetical protein
MAAMIRDLDQIADMGARRVRGRRGSYMTWEQLLEWCYRQRPMDKFERAYVTDRLARKLHKAKAKGAKLTLVGPLPPDPVELEQRPERERRGAKGWRPWRGRNEADEAHQVDFDEIWSAIPGGPVK